MLKNNNLRFLLNYIFICIFLAGVNSNCVKKTAPIGAHVVIGYQEIALYRHIFVAKEKGYFQEEGLSVELKSIVSANRMMEALIAGELDALGLTNLQVALTIEGKDPGHFKLANMLIWREASFPDYILVRTKANIKDVKDLEGKTIGLHPGSAVKAFAREVFDSLQISQDKMTLLELEPTTMQAAVASGRVDAIYCMDPVATTLLQSGEAIVLIANPMQYIFHPPVPISGLALSTTLINEQPEKAQKIIRAVERAVEHMRTPGREHEVSDIISKYTPITKEIALKMNPSEYWNLEEMDESQIQKLADRFFNLKIVEKQIDVKTILLPKDFGK